MKQLFGNLASAGLGRMGGGLLGGAILGKKKMETREKPNPWIINNLGGGKPLI
jgi:hypothetical protein